MTPAVPTQFNLARYLLEDRLAEGRGDHTALILPDARVTYAGLAHRARQVASLLNARGVTRGDRVLIALDDGIDFAATLLGTLACGAVATATNPDLPSRDHAAQLAYCQARALVCEPAVAMQVGPAPGHQCAILVTGTQTIPGSTLLSAAERMPPLAALADTRADDPACWLFTSGSTGAPKAAVHGHGDFAHHIERYAKGVLGMHAGDITLAVPKLHFPYATGMNLLFPLAVGARAVLVRGRPTAEQLSALLAQHRPTIFSTVPTMTAKLLALPGGLGRLPSLRLATSAGEALPPDLFRRWTETTGVEMLDGIGSAEMFHVYLTNHPGRARPGSLGSPVPGYELRIVRDDGGDARDGETGILWVRGPSAARAYHGDPARSAAVFRPDGWVVTGDFMHRDPDGLYVYEGRADDMLKVGGIYVSPLEVESVLREHPEVEDCAVVGQPDGDSLIKPRAFIVARAGGPPPTVDTLVEHTRQRLAHYKVPRTWTFVDNLPRNDRGKMLRAALRQRP